MNIPSSSYSFTIKKPCLTPHLYRASLFVCTILTLLLAGVHYSTSVYAPVDFLRLACGQYDMDGEQFWAGDIYSKYSPIEEYDQPGIKSVDREAPLSSNYPKKVPYSKARLSRSSFTYKFSFNTAGQKFIRLYFNPASYPNFDRSSALFSVKAGGFTLLHDFNASLTADAYGIQTLYREFCLNIGEKEESLYITFSPSRAANPEAYAFINGFEIASMPSNLYYNLLTRGEKFRIENSTALEMVYRINIGGSPISSDEVDSLQRKWDGLTQEEKYLDKISLRSPLQTTSLPLKISTIQEYAAPEEVYQSFRSTDIGRSLDNISWQFPVDSNFSYMLRLHFCELQHYAAKTNRGFEIKISNQIAEEIVLDSGAGIPNYIDFAAAMSSLGTGSMHKKSNLSITLGAYHKEYNALLNGLEIFKLNDSTANLAGPNPDPSPPKKLVTPQPFPSHKTDKSTTSRMLGILAGAVSGILMLISVAGFFIFRRRRKVKSSGSSHGTPKSKKTCGTPLPAYLCPYFSLSEIKAATQNFNEECIIGVGGFGNVYRGCLGDGATTMAIKRLKPESSQGAHEFKTEIELLSQFRHRNLVSLVGYCTDEDEMILVYEYMAHGTLADHLYHKHNPPLSWEQRLYICLDVARGLQYLHSGTNGTIIHRDVKSTNILLDENWVAKLSDFGLSKMGMITASKTHITTKVKGSFGYLDPDYYRRQQLTEKADVYSFGVVLCEVLCARPALLHTVEKKQMNLAGWAKTCWGDGTIDQIIDPNLKGQIEVGCLDKFVEIAMGCIEDKGIERPSMNEVAKGLEFSLQIQQNCIESNGDPVQNTTKTTTSKPSNLVNQSIICISQTIFSEINNPDGR